MPSASLAAHLAAAAPVSSPFGFLATIESWLLSLEQSALATQAQRDQILATVMAIYDALAVSLGKTNVLMGAAFGAFRPTFEAAIAGLLNFLAPGTPAPAVVPAVQGAEKP